MNKNTTFHSYKVKDIVEKFSDRNIIIDESYQRRTVWLLRDKVRLIETILNDYLVPPLYLWDAEIDADSGDAVQHIVDGQQRITAIVDFIEGDYKLDERYLMLDADIREQYENCKFSELDRDLKVKIWSYDLPAIDLRSEVTSDQIRTIFTRLNLTEYSLNNQERRHSDKQGLFAQTAYELSESSFWDDNRLFNASDLRRMKDIEFCASLLILARKGIIDQTTQKALNEAYDDYKDEYEEREEDIEKVVSWMEILDTLCTTKTLGFLRKKTQLYTMFCIADFITEEEISVSQTEIDNFERYVEAYNEFKNDDDNNHIPEDILETITTHKLASSEGIHKSRNRVLRFQSIQKALFPES